MTRKRRHTPTKGTNPPPPQQLGATRESDVHDVVIEMSLSPELAKARDELLADHADNGTNYPGLTSPLVLRQTDDVVLEPDAFVTEHGRLTGDGRAALVACVSDIRRVLDGLQHAAIDGTLCSQNLLVLDKCKTCTRVIEMLGVLRDA